MVPQFLSKTKTQTDQEKSVLLAKAMEWRVHFRRAEEESGSWGSLWRRGAYCVVDADNKKIPRLASNPQTGFYPRPQDGPVPSMMYLEDFPQLDFYIPENMALAWRVHLWACNHQFNTTSWPYLGWFERKKIFEYNDAQIRWLDKTFDLCVEEGIAEEK